MSRPMPTAALSQHQRALARLFENDPMAEAERQSGLCAADHPGTRRMGQLIGLRQLNDRRALLAETDDSWWGCRFEDFKRIAGEEGFTRSHVHHFSDGAQSGATAERFETWTHPDGPILTFDSWSAEYVNAAWMWFNLMPSKGITPRALSMGDGGFANGVWAAGVNVDCGLRYHLGCLRSIGSLCTWQARPAAFHLVDRSAVLMGQVADERALALSHQRAEAAGAPLAGLLELPSN